MHPVLRAIAERFEADRLLLGFEHEGTLESERVGAEGIDVGGGCGQEVEGQFNAPALGGAPWCPQRMAASSSW